MIDDSEESYKDILKDWDTKIYNICRIYIGLAR